MGKWNERDRTITGQGELPDGSESQAETHFINTDLYEWKSIGKDTTGKVNLEMQGKHTRVADPGPRKEVIRRRITWPASAAVRWPSSGRRLRTPRAI